MKFKKSSVSFEKTNSFNRLVVDYMTGNENIKNLYNYADDLKGLEETILSYTNKRLNRKKLSSVLKSQYIASGIKEINPQVLKNINLIENENTFSVTTGHQLNILGGPLFVFYKIISIIKLCVELRNKFTQYNFIPVFWMATEDHDIDEISTISLFGKKIKWETKSKGPAGRIKLHDFKSIIEEVKNKLGNSENAQQLISLLNSAYSEVGSLADATRKWFDYFFGEYGVVIIDGNETGLKELVTDIFIDEIEFQTSHKLISETIKSLPKNYPVQANPREINLFYLEENFRERIVQKGEDYAVLNSNKLFSKTELINQIKTHPGKFSPNVVMRPLFQESILPDIAYIGGPGEISYWLELKTTFDHYEIPFPCIFMRSSAMIFESSVLNKLQMLNINSESVFLTTDEMIRKYLESKNVKNPFENLQELLRKEFDTVIHEVSKLDITLKPAIEAEKQRLIAGLTTLEEKILRAEKKKNETDINRIKKIKDYLFPGGDLQEREESFIPFFLKSGKDFISSLMQNLNPLEKEFILLEEDAD